MKQLAALLMLSLVLLSACGSPPTSDIEATVRAGGAAAPTAQSSDTAKPTNTLVLTAATPAPDIEATVGAAVAEALTALPSATSTPKPTNTPLPASVTSALDVEATVRSAVAEALTALPSAAPPATPTDARVLLPTAILTADVEAAVAAALTALPSATPTPTLTTTRVPAAATSTPDMETTVEAAVAAALTALPSATPTPTLTTTRVPAAATPTPDIEATVQAAVAAALTALPTATPWPTLTPTPSATPTNTAAPPTDTPAPSPTPTSEPAPPAAPAPNPPPQVESAAGDQPFDYGIQVDPRGNKEANIGHIQALGFRWVKLQMPWKEVEPHPGNYQWGTWDDVIGAYSGAGIKILLSIPKSPDWARPPGTDLSVEGPPADYGTFAHFLGEVARRYSGRVQAIEVWNEQNLWYEGGGMPIPPDQYVAMLSAGYQAIKAADPNMIVVSGAPTPAGDVGTAAIDDIGYLNAMYAAGLKDVSDAIGAHPSGYNCPAGASWETVNDSTATNFRGTFENRHHSWCYRSTMEGYRNVMVANGDGAKTIWPTEFGWAVSHMPHVGYEYAADNTLEEQAQWTVEAYQMGKQWGWVGTAFLWNLDYGVTAAGTELAQWGLLQPGGPVPAYHALAAMPK